MIHLVNRTYKFLVLDRLINLPIFLDFSPNNSMRVSIEIMKRSVFDAWDKIKLSSILNFALMDGNNDVYPHCYPNLCFYSV